MNSTQIRSRLEILLADILSDRLERHVALPDFVRFISACTNPAARMDLKEAHKWAGIYFDDILSQNYGGRSTVHRQLVNSIEAAIHKLSA